MKRRVLLLSAFIFSMGAIYAQGEMDAYKLSQKDLSGTARSVSMGGAFGALGGDISAISINPAGIGVYKTSEIVTTLNFQNTKTKTNSNIGSFEESKFKFNFDNLGFVSVFPINSDVTPSINFGFSYNRVKNFDRKYYMDGTSPNSTMAGYIAYRLDDREGTSNPENTLKFKDDNDIVPLEKYPWLGVFGYNSKIALHDAVADKYSVNPLVNRPADQNLFVSEKGSVSSYDFNVGTTISNIVSLGMTLSVTDIKYNLFSEFNEDYTSKDGFTLRNEMRTEGAGFQVGVGVIVKPVNELRIGLAYHSPTWYNMTDYYGADFVYDLSGLGQGMSDNSIITPEFRYDYRLRTPDRFTFSLAGVIGQIAILSADYEYANYGSNMKLFKDNGSEMSNNNPNVDIKSDFRGASTLRLGAEVRITPQFSGRVGYAWKQSPLKKDLKDNKKEVMTAGSITHFTLDGDTNYFTYGLGYRFSRNFYSDVAFVMRSQKADLYAYDNSEKTEWKDNTFQGVLTLGYRF